MGRWDYFITSVGVSLASLIPCALIYVFYIQIVNVDGSAEQFTEFWSTARFLPLIPLMLRRLVAIQWPSTVLWAQFGFGFAVGLAGLADDSNFSGAVAIADGLIAIVLLFAPSKVEPVTANPNL